MLHGHFLFSAPQNRLPLEPKTGQQTALVFFGAHNATDSPRSGVDYAKRIGRQAALGVAAFLRFTMALFGCDRQNHHDAALSLLGENSRDYVTRLLAMEFLRAASLELIAG